MKWKIEWDENENSTDWYFREWWNVTDGEKNFKTTSKEDAEWLCNHLNLSTN